MQDLRFAFRQLLKTPGFSAVVILSIALGIGANTTVLCWLRALVLHPLPGVKQQEQMVVVVSNSGGGNASLPDLRDIGNLREVFAGTAASMSTPACLTIDLRQEWILAQVVTANFFDLLGVGPALGRTFLPDEDLKPGGNPVIVISESLWRRRFDRDPSVIGRTIELNRRSFTIIGVAPLDFRGSMSPGGFDVWAPASMIWEVRNQGTHFLTSRSARGWHNLARLQPGVTVEQAHAAVTALDAQLARAYPQTNTNAHHRVTPLSKCPWGAQTVMGPALRLLLAVSAGVLLIVAANVANLLLARGASRQKEIAIRLTSGASRVRLVRQLLTESLVLGTLGGVLGVLGASWAVDAVPLFLPAELARTARFDFPLDAGTLSLTVALTVGTALLFGLIPALQASRPNLYATLKEGGRSSHGGTAAHRLRSALVVGEIAVALVLLVGAGLCAKGLQQARQTDVGFRSDHVLLGNLQIGMNGYDRETGIGFYQRLRERLALLPGVEQAALASWFPLGLSGCKGTDLFVEGYQRPPGENETYEYAIVSPGYFGTMRIPLISGRDFNDRDDGTAPRVAIVNEAFAQRFWPGENALGRRFRSNGAWWSVVGVTKTGKYNRMDEAASPFFYRPFLQGVPDLDLSLCIRTRDDPVAYAGAVRETLRQLDPGVELVNLVPLSTHSSLVLFPQRMTSVLLALLATVALLLAAMGVYAVIAYAVNQRTQEFGVRMALGARSSDVVWQVVRRGLALALLGTAIGLVAAFALARVLTGFLFGVNPFDPAIFAAVSLVLLMIAALACYAPARRATRVDPIVALRAD